MEKGCLSIDRCGTVTTTTESRIRNRWSVLLLLVRISALGRKMTDAEIQASYDDLERQALPGGTSGFQFRKGLESDSDVAHKMLLRLIAHELVPPAMAADIT